MDSTMNNKKIMTWITKYMMNIYQGWDNKPKNIMSKHLSAYVIQNWP